MLIKSIRLGSNDLARTRAFYEATFGALGVTDCVAPEEYPVVFWDIGGGVKFFVGPARDGRPATHANGGTVVFQAPSEEAVRAWAAAGLAHGGTCGGRPEPKLQAEGGRHRGLSARPRWQQTGGILWAADGLMA